MSKWIFLLNSTHCTFMTTHTHINCRKQNTEIIIKKINKIRKGETGNLCNKICRQFGIFFFFFRFWNIIQLFSFPIQYCFGSFLYIFFSSPKLYSATTNSSKCQKKKKKIPWKWKFRAKNKKQHLRKGFATFRLLNWSQITHKNEDGIRLKYDVGDDVVNKMFNHTFMLVWWQLSKRKRTLVFDL